MSDKPWMKQPGDVHDSKGYPIYPGDLLRSYHFTGARRKVYYLYHIAAMIDGAMRMVSSHECPYPKDKLPGCLLSDDLGKAATILCGYGPVGIPFDERPRRKS